VRWLDQRGYNFSMLTAEVIRCPNCGANNRVAPERLANGEAPVCGRCKTPLPINKSNAPPGGHPITVTDATLAQLVDRSSVPVLLDLWAPWCGPCRMIAPTLEKLAAEWGDKVRVAKINVDQNPMSAQRFDARSIPLLVVLKFGQEVDRLVGVQPVNVIRDRVARHL